MIDRTPTSLRSPAKHPLTSGAVVAIYRTVVWRVTGIATIVIVAFSVLVLGIDKQKTIIESLLTLTSSVSSFLNSTIKSLESSVFWEIVILFVIVYKFIGHLPSILEKYFPERTEALMSRLLPLADGTWSALETNSDDEKKTLRPKSGDSFFYDRKEFKEKLIDFCLSAKPYDYMFLEGPSGIGKSRLALGLIESLVLRRVGPLKPVGNLGFARYLVKFDEERPWDAGFMSQSVQISALANEVTDWIPFRPTLIVVDATRCEPSAVKGFLYNLAEHADRLTYPLRALILTYRYSAAIDPAGFWDSNAGKTRRVRLTGLSLDSVGQLLRDHSIGRSIDDTQVRHVYETTGGLPFLVRLAVGAEGVSRRAPVSVLTNLMARAILEQATGTAFSATPNLAGLAEALAVACLIGRLDFNKPEPILGIRRNEFIGKSEIYSDQEAIYSCEPPLLALAYLWRFSNGATAQQLDTIAHEAWKRSPDRMLSTLFLFWINVARNPKFTLPDFDLQDSDTRWSARWNFSDPAWLAHFDAPPKTQPGLDQGKAAAIRAFWLLLQLHKRREGVPLSDDEKARISEVVFAEQERVLTKEYDVLVATALAGEWADSLETSGSNAWRLLLYANRRYPGVASIQRYLLRGARNVARAWVTENRVDTQEIIELHDAVTDVQPNLLLEAGGRYNLLSALADCIHSLLETSERNRIPLYYERFCTIYDHGPLLPIDAFAAENAVRSALIYFVDSEDIQHVVLAARRYKGLISSGMPPEVSDATLGWMLYLVSATVVRWVGPTNIEKLDEPLRSQTGSLAYEWHQGFDLDGVSLKDFENWLIESIDRLELRPAALQQIASIISTRYSFYMELDTPELFHRGAWVRRMITAARSLMQKDGLPEKALLILYDLVERTWVKTMVNLSGTDLPASCAVVRAEIEQRLPGNSELELINKERQKRIEIERELRSVKGEAFDKYVEKQKELLDGLQSKIERSMEEIISFKNRFLDNPGDENDDKTEKGT